MSLKVKANVELIVRDATSGRILSHQRVKNTVVDTGLNIVRDLLGGTGYGPASIAVGTGTAATGTTDTSLGTEIWRGNIDRRIQGSKEVNFQVLLTTADANGYTLSEVGLFDGTSMYARALLSPTIEKTGAKTVTISHKITVARG
jgi:hypothetical protein